MKINKFNAHRVIVIGNGFDQAHGLKTGYRDFFDNHWETVISKIFSNYQLWIAKNFGTFSRPSSYDDCFINLKVIEGKSAVIMPKFCEGIDLYNDLCGFIAKLNADNDFAYTLHLTFKNEFFKHISERCSLMNWLDIENEYYVQLKELLAENNAMLRHEKVRKLNLDFDAVRKRLVSYLSEIVSEIELKPFPSIQDVFSSQIQPIEVACGKQRFLSTQSSAV